MGLMLASFFALLLLVIGTYGVWHSATAEEFTAREVNTGRAKYPYRPKLYQRALHFTVSLGFAIAASTVLIHLWKSN
jgi:flagellar basal body-associated protein FliL